jgi:hypothetical protein
MLGLHQIDVLVIFHQLLAQKLLADHNILAQICDFLCELNVVGLGSSESF